MIQGEGGMSSMRKEESKSALQILNKSSQLKTSTETLVLSLNFQYKRKKEKEKKFLSFCLRDEGDVEKNVVDARRERVESVNLQFYSLLGTRLSRPDTYYLMQEQTSIRRC